MTMTRQDRADDDALPPAFQSATTCAARIRRGETSSRDVVERCLARIDKYNARINAVIVLQADEARRRADAADAAVARGDAVGPLHGVPITVKESYDVAGLPSTFGLEALRDNIAARDALAVTRLVEAGAILLGKTNVPPSLADWQTINPIYGTTRNPWDLERTPGGSSGGAAAALAAGFSMLEIGSDIGGSIRMPAHFCGVYGHKPSFGLVPTRGHAQPGRTAPSDISVCGPMARSAADLDLALSLLAGSDPETAPGWRLDLPAGTPRLGGVFRVAIMADDADFSVDHEISDALRSVAASLRRAGVVVDEGARPDFTSRDCYEIYANLLRSATSARQSDAEFADNQAQAAALAPDDRSYRALLLRGNTLSHRAWLGFEERRYDLIAAWRQFFGRYDLFLCPVASTAAFRMFGDVPKYARTVTVDGKELPSANDYFWQGLAAVAYLPATTIPIALSSGGLPIGAQIIGGFGADRACIAMASMLERAHHGFTAPPAFAA